MKSLHSNSYQSFFHEIPYDPQVMVQFSDEDTATSFAYSEEAIELRAKLMELLLNMAQEKLTQRQWQCLTAFLQGATQMEIKKMMNIKQQNCIARSFNFNCNPKVYGGIIPKLKKLAAHDPAIQALIQEIRKLNE